MPCLVRRKPWRRKKERSRKIWRSCKWSEYILIDSTIMAIQASTKLPTHFLFFFLSHLWNFALWLCHGPCVFLKTQPCDRLNKTSTLRSGYDYAWYLRNLHSKISQHKCSPGAKALATTLSPSQPQHNCHASVSLITPLDDMFTGDVCYDIAWDFRNLVIDYEKWCRVNCPVFICVLCVCAVVGCLSSIVKQQFVNSACVQFTAQHVTMDNWVASSLLSQCYF